MSFSGHRQRSADVAHCSAGEVELWEVRMTITLFDPRTGKPVTITVPDRRRCSRSSARQSEQLRLGSVAPQIASPLSGP